MSPGRSFIPLASLRPRNKVLILFLTTFDAATPANFSLLELEPILERPRQSSLDRLHDRLGGRLQAGLEAPDFRPHGVQDTLAFPRGRRRTGPARTPPGPMAGPEARYSTGWLPWPARQGRRPGRFDRGVRSPGPWRPSPAGPRPGSGAPPPDRRGGEAAGCRRRPGSGQGKPPAGRASGGDHPPLSDRCRQAQPRGRHRAPGRSRRRQRVWAPVPYPAYRTERRR